MSNTKCWLKKPPHNQCCCNCKNLLKLNLHCWHVVEKPKDMGCVCGIQIGWVCAGFAYEGIVEFFGTDKDFHSIGCEMYSAKKVKKAKEGKE